MVSIPGIVAAHCGFRGAGAKSGRARGFACPERSRREPRTFPTSRDAKGAPAPKLSRYAGVRATDEIPSEAEGASGPSSFILRRVAWFGPIFGS
jgi:hypothetical protein